MKNYTYLLLLSCFSFSIIVFYSCQKDDDDEIGSNNSLSAALYGVYGSSNGEFKLELGDTTFKVNGMNYYFHIDNTIQNDDNQFKFTTHNGVEHHFMIQNNGNIIYKFITKPRRSEKNGYETKGISQIFLKTAAKKIIKYGVSTAGCRDTKGLDVGNNKLYILAKLSNFNYDVITIKLREDGSLPLDPEDPDITNVDSTNFASDAAGSEGSDVVFQENNSSISSTGDYIHIVKKSLYEVKSYFATNIDQGETNGITTNLATGVGTNPRQGESANEYLYLNSNDKMVYIGKFRPDNNKDKIGKVKINNNDCNKLHGLCIEPKNKNLLFVSCSNKEDQYWIESYSIDPKSDRGAKNFTYNGSTASKTKARNYQQLICDGSILYALSNHQGHTLDVFDLNLNTIEIENHYALQDVLDEMQLVDFMSSDMALSNNTLYISNGDDNSDEERRIVMINLVDYAQRAGVSENLSTEHSIELNRQ